MNRAYSFAAVVALGFGLNALAQTARQPKVAPGPNEPDWAVILQDRYGLSMFGDLLNPVRTTPAEPRPASSARRGPGRSATSR